MSGRIESVEDNTKLSDSIVHVSVVDVYRQIENHFTQYSDEQGEVNSHSFHWQDTVQRDSNLVTTKYIDAVMVPKKCGVKVGSGQFLFLGRFRLGQAVLQCAPRLEDFSAMWQRAVEKQENPCTVNWNL